MHRLTVIQKESSFLDGLNGAVVAASATANTGVSIDDVLVSTLGDSLDGAVVGAGAALNASVSNLVCHDFPSICYLAHNVPIASRDGDSLHTF